MADQCPACGAAVFADADGRRPPWCPKCGSDLKKPAAAAAGGEGPAPATPGGQPPRPVFRAAAASAAALQCGKCLTVVRPGSDGRMPPWCSGCGADMKDAVPPPPEALAMTAEDDLGNDERFSGHNMLVGLGLAIWAGLLAMRATGVTQHDKIIDADKLVGNTINVLQMLTVANGVLLFVSGIAIRNQLAWGRWLAMWCGLGSLLLGLAFFAGVLRIGNKPGMVEAVTKMYFIQKNFDLLLGFVDGLFLLYLVMTAKPPARPPAHRGRNFQKVDA